MSPSLEQKILFVYLAIIALLVPFFVIKNSVFPFVFPRAIFFQAGIAVMFPLWFYWLLAKKIALRLKKIDWALLAFLAIIIITALAGFDFRKSFWSNQERMEGILSLTFFYIFYFMLRSALVSQKQWQWLARILLLGGLLSCVYALLQQAGVSWALFAGVPRLSGLLGNPTYLASYLVLLVFIGWQMIWQEKNIIWRSGYLGFILLAVYIIFKTLSRGPLLGLAIGFTFLLLYKVIKPHRPRERWLWLVILAAIILLASGVWQMHKLPWLNDMAPYTLRRLSSTYINWDSSSQVRLLAWQSAFKAFASRPVTGWGYDNYEIAFWRFFNPQLAQTGSVWFDRSHNKIIDLAVMAGSVGLLSYLIIFALIFIKTGQHKKFVFTGFFIAYFTQNLFAFDTILTYLLFFAALAWLMSLAHGD